MPENSIYPKWYYIFSAKLIQTEKEPNGMKPTDYTDSHFYTNLIYYLFVYFCLVLIPNQSTVYNKYHSMEYKFWS